VPDESVPIGSSRRTPRPAARDANGRHRGRRLQIGVQTPDGDISPITEVIG